jgi:hypothetical protein
MVGPVAWLNGSIALQWGSEPSRKALNAGFNFTGTGMTPHIGIADIKMMFDWIPSWIIGPGLIVGAVLLALVVYGIAASLVNRTFGTRVPVISVFIDRTAGPARLSLCLAAIAMVMPLAPLDDEIRTPLTHLFVVAFIGLIGWISIRIVDMSAARYLQNFRDVTENFIARKHVTQSACSSASPTSSSRYPRR